jgi:hypothetical protein
LRSTPLWRSACSTRSRPPWQSPGCRSRRRNGRHPRLPGLQRLRCRSPAPVPSTARLISRPDAAVLGLRVAVGDPALDELAGELLSHHSWPSDGCRAWKGKLSLDRRACLWREPQRQPDRGSRRSRKKVPPRPELGSVAAGPTGTRGDRPCLGRRRPLWRSCRAVRPAMPAVGSDRQPAPTGGSPPSTPPWAPPATRRWPPSDMVGHRAAAHARQQKRMRCDHARRQDRPALPSG